MSDEIKCIYMDLVVDNFRIEKIGSYFYWIKYWKYVLGIHTGSVISEETDPLIYRYLIRE